MDMSIMECTKDSLVGWLEDVISRELQISLSDIRNIRRFDALGVDSLLAAYIASELTNRLGRSINIDTVYDHGDLYTLAEQMGKQA